MAEAPAQPSIVDSFTPPPAYYGLFAKGSDALLPPTLPSDEQPLDENDVFGGKFNTSVLDKARHHFDLDTIDVKETFRRCGIWEKSALSGH
jgi:hypothetical protein